MTIVENRPSSTPGAHPQRIPRHRRCGTRAGRAHRVRRPDWSSMPPRVCCSRLAGRCRRARRRRLRPAAALSLFRYRPAAAVRIGTLPQTAQRDAIAALPAAPLGRRPAHQPLGAHPGRVRRAPRQQHRAEHQPARPALPHRRPHALRRLADRLPRFIHASRDALVRNLCAADARAPRQVRRHLLSPRAEHQGDARRPARSISCVCWLEHSCARPQPSPRRELRDACHFLARLRCYLHCRRRPRQQRAHLRRAGRLAEHWQRATPPQWMREYYRHARAIYRAATRAARSQRRPGERPVRAVPRLALAPLQRRFQRVRERVHFRAPQQLERRARPGPAPLRVRGAPRRPAFARSRAADRGTPAALAATTSRSRAPSGRRCSESVAAARAPGPPRHARYRRAAPRLPRVRAIECLVVRDFYPSLHGGRAHAGHHRRLWRSCGAPPSRCRSLSRTCLRRSRARRLLFRAAVSRRGQGHAGEGHVDGSLRARAEPPWRGSRCRRRIARRSRS